MITALYTQYGTGEQRRVQVWETRGDKAQVVDLDFKWSGNGLETWPIRIVDKSSLSDFIWTCPKCGAQNDPSSPCQECGWDWRQEISDQQDTRETEQALRLEYQGGQL